MTQAAPFVSVIVPHYNDLDGLRLCLALLDRQTLPHDRFEVVVADNNSACGLDAVRQAAPGARVILAPEQGAGPARNAGVAASRGDILAFIDSDCTAEPAWLAEGLHALPAFDFVGGQVRVTCAVPGRPNAVEAFEMVFNFDFRRYIEDVGFTGTGNMFVTRAVFDQVGPFRTGVSEDMEWSFRAREKGFRLGYAERAVVGHPARRDWPDLLRRWGRIVSEHNALAQETRFGRPKLLLRALAMPLSIAPHGWRVLRSPRLQGAPARLGALGVLARLRLWRAQAMLRRLVG